MQTVLTASNLRIVRGARVLLGDLSFSIEAGECLSLVGEPGSGRTTLFRMLNGTLPVPCGTVSFFGDESAPNIAFVPFAGASDALTSVRETVRRAAERAGIAADLLEGVVNDRLEEAGLIDDGHRLVGTIDYGQRRLVEIVAALIGDPDLLIVDDPAETVAPRSREVIYAMLVGAAQRGIAVLQLTSRAEDAEALGGRVRIMPAPTALHELATAQADTAQPRAPLERRAA